MISVPELQRIAPVEVSPSLEHLWRRLHQLTSSIDASDEKAHEEADLALTGLIEDIVVPKLGPHEREGAPWFHSMDFHGDGVRLIEALPGHLSSELCASLHHLLVGRFAPFSVLWKVMSEDWGKCEGAVVVRAQQILVTRPLILQVVRPGTTERQS